MHFRFIEAEDEERTNHGKFALFKFGEKEWQHRSGINDGALLATLKPVARLGGALTKTSILFCDLQTREALFVDPARGRELTTRDFLLHPVHVCILAYPLLMLLVSKPDAIWSLPNVVRLPLDGVLAQPGLLLDATGSPVRGRFEGQDVLTPEERAEAASAAERPRW